MMNRDIPVDSAAFEPPVIMTDEGSCICLRISLPGVMEEQIRIDLEKTTCTVCVSDKERMVTKTLRVPQGARLSRKKFSDGVLEIFLDKSGS